jgi:hypothetical protein
VAERLRRRDLALVHVHDDEVVRVRSIEQDLVVVGRELGDANPFESRVIAVALEQRNLAGEIVVMAVTGPGGAG